MPNQQRTLNKLPPELRCRNLVNKHRLSIQVGAERAKTCMQRVYILTELPFCIPPLVVGQAEKRRRSGEEVIVKNFPFFPLNFLLQSSSGGGIGERLSRGFSNDGK